MMSDSLIWWGVQFFLSGLDFVMMYIIAHTLMLKKIQVKKEHTLLGVIFIILASSGFYFLDGRLGLIVSNLLVISMMKIIIKRIGWKDLPIVYLISFIVIGMAQTVPLVAAYLLSFGELAMFLTGQIIAIIAVAVISNVFKWYYAFHKIRANLILKLILFVGFLLILFFASMLNFRTENIIFSGVAIILVFNVLFPIFLQLYQKVADHVPADELRTNLFTTAWNMIEESNSDKRYEIYAELASIYGEDVSGLLESQNRSEEKESHMKMMNENIQQFVRERMEISGKMLEIKSEITYHAECRFVNYDLAIKWLNVLLDHAFSSANENPIYIRLYSFENSFSLDLASECRVDERRKLETIFEWCNKDNWDKLRLYQLYQKVVELGGTVELDEYHSKDYNCSYLQISIEIEKEEIIS